MNRKPAYMPYHFGSNIGDAKNVLLKQQNLGVFVLNPIPTQIFYQSLAITVQNILNV